MVTDRARSPDAGTPRTVARGVSRGEVASAIRHGVLAADLVPGQRLVEADLCAMLGASRSTVRAALLDLAEEGLVERSVRRSARIRVVEVDEAVAITGRRLVIERLCAVRAAERIGDADVRLLRTLRDALSEEDIDGFADTTAAIRALYIRVADLPAAAEAVSRLRAQTASYRLRPAYRAHRARTAVAAWRAIADAICARDGRAAGAALDRHMRLVQDSMRAFGNDDRPFAAPYPAR